MMTKLEKLQIKTQEAIWFLGQHPAIASQMNPVFSAIDFQIERVCKRGFEESCKRGIQITIRSKLAKKFKEEFKKKLEKLKQEIDEKEYNLESHFMSIWKSYKEVFNEQWKFDHVQYYGSVSFFVFHGKNTDLKEEMNLNNWQRYEGMQITKRTFEEMIIALASQFKKIFGDFTDDDFITKKEKENHKKHRSYLHKKIKNSRFIRLVKNPEYIRVSDAEINRRWLKWFVKTDYAKKNWAETFDEILKGKK